MSSLDPLPAHLRQQVNRRLSLNLLIQGAATHVFLTAHHLISDELNALDVGLVPAYDQLMPRAHLGYFVGGIPLLLGNPKKFWRRINRPSNPFCFHPFLSKYGPQLAREARSSIFEKCRDQGIWINGITNEIGVMKVYLSALQKELPHIPTLERLGKKVCSDIYGIGVDQLNAQITTTPAWGTVRRPETWRGRMAIHLMIGWGGVERRDGRIGVTAKASTWPLLLHELVKGTVELICLHGLGRLEDDSFDAVMNHTEHLEYEFPMIQIGGEFFKKFLAVLPREISLAQCILHVANFAPEQLDQFLVQMIDSPNRATDLLRNADEKFNE
jgi:hypothetical protein